MTDANNNNNNKEEEVLKTQLERVAHMEVLEGEIEPKEITADAILEILLTPKSPTHRIKDVLPASQIIYFLQKAREVFESQTSLIELKTPVNICGDTHAQFNDVIRLFGKCGWPPKQNYLFLGDYVDRGPYNIETALLLLVYKVKYPNNFFMLRGNHECWPVNKAYGFFDECIRRYRSKVLWRHFQVMFEQIPLVALVGGTILAMHGGISNKIESIDQLRAIARPMICPRMDSPEMDLLWADPSLEGPEYEKNMRGTSVCFGWKAMADFLAKHNLSMVVRAHQVVQDGYEILFDGKLVTIFSAPHYCGFQNAAAVMKVSKDLIVSFVRLLPSTAMKKP